MILLRGEFNSNGPHDSMQALEKHTCLERLAIHSDGLPSFFRMVCRLGVHFLTIVIHDKRGAGDFNLESPAAILESLCKEVGGYIKGFMWGVVPASCVN